MKFTPAADHCIHRTLKKAAAVCCASSKGFGDSAPQPPKKGSKGSKAKSQSKKKLEHIIQDQVLARFVMRAMPPSTALHAHAHVIDQQPVFTSCVTITVFLAAYRPSAVRFALPRAATPDQSAAARPPRAAWTMCRCRRCTTACAELPHMAATDTCCARRRHPARRLAGSVADV